MAFPLRRQESGGRAPSASPQGPRLALAPRRRRSWAAVFIGAAIFVVLAGLLGAAVFHTQLAERQIRINAIERAVAAERDRFDELRYRRAELRSPARLATEAARLGMVRGDTGDFVEIDPWMVARQLAAAGVIDDSARQIVLDTDPLEQFSDVKRVSADNPEVGR